MRQKHRPVIYLIGGPNGAGKTTFAREFLPAAEVVEFLNVDLLAAGLSPLRPEAMAVRSARILLQRWQELLALGRSFAFESTLSGKTYASMLRDAKVAGYCIRMCYLWLPSLEVSLQRVRQRVRKGGHNVLEYDIRRRFRPSLHNFFQRYLPMADEAVLFDAGSFPPQLVARWASGNSEVINQTLYEEICRQAKATGSHR